MNEAELIDAAVSTGSSTNCEDREGVYIYTFDSFQLLEFVQRIQPQWLPIETCPRDLAVDVMCRSNLGNTNYFTRVTDAVYMSSGRWNGLSSWHVPTHWMPLPKPPEGDK